MIVEQVRLTAIAVVNSRFLQPKSEVANLQVFSQNRIVRQVRPKSAPNQDQRDKHAVSNTPALDGVKSLSSERGMEVKANQGIILGKRVLSVLSEITAQR